MGRGEGVGHLQGDAHCLALGQGPALVEKPAERYGFDVLQNETCGTGLQQRVVHRHDARMGEPRHAQRLSAEPFPDRRLAVLEVQELYENRAVQDLIARRPEIGSRTARYVL